jgi:hypothetical protein
MNEKPENAIKIRAHLCPNKLFRAPPKKKFLIRENPSNPWHPCSIRYFRVPQKEKQPTSGCFFRLMTPILNPIRPQHRFPVWIRHVGFDAQSEAFQTKALAMLYLSHIPRLLGAECGNRII